MDDYLAKPVSRAELYRVLARTVTPTLAARVEDLPASRIL